MHPRPTWLAFFRWIRFKSGYFAARSRVLLQCLLPTMYGDPGGNVLKPIQADSPGVARRC